MAANSKMFYKNGLSKALKEQSINIKKKLLKGGNSDLSSMKSKAVLSSKDVPKGGGINSKFERKLSSLIVKGPTISIEDTKPEADDDEDQPLKFDVKDLIQLKPDYEEYNTLDIKGEYDEKAFTLFK